MATNSPLEKTILLAMKQNDITAADLAGIVGMAPTNFSLARNNHRALPLAALLKICDLAGLDSDEKLKVVEWIAFKQVVDIQKRKVPVKKKVRAQVKKIVKV